MIFFSYILDKIITNVLNTKYQTLTHK